MSHAPSKREILRLGDMGSIPADTLFELFLDTERGDMLTFYQTRCQASIGGWVYDAAACLAKYLETEHFRNVCLPLIGQPFSAFIDRSVSSKEQNQSAINHNNPESALSAHINGCTGIAEQRLRSNEYRCLEGLTAVELGAGTGVVGIMAGYLGADVTITDLDTLVALLEYNVRKNNHLINLHQDTNSVTSISKDEIEEKARVNSDQSSGSVIIPGRVICRSLYWGNDVTEAVTSLPPDLLILANCVYYESSLEALLQSVLDLTNPLTLVLLCYEVRTPEISRLIDRWHLLVKSHFHIVDLEVEKEKDLLDKKYAQPFVKFYIFKKIVPKSLQKPTLEY